MVSDDSDATFYAEIEDAFLAKARTGKLVVSPADWDQMRQWRQAGIPLRIILRAIDDTKLTHARTLRYLSEPVKAAYAHWRAALGPG